MKFHSITINTNGQLVNASAVIIKNNQNISFLNIVTNLYKDAEKVYVSENSLILIDDFLMMCINFIKVCDESFIFETI